MNYLYPKPYVDEVLYSVNARYSDRMCFPSRRSVNIELFGDANIIATVALPSNLEKLVSNLAHGYPYTADNMIEQHTLYPYYSPFLSCDQARQLRSDMLGSRGSAIYMRAGIMASRVAPPEHLRFCPLCVRDDKEQYGETFWHRVHQLQGIPICPTHGADLVNSSIKPRGGSVRYEYFSAERALNSTVEPTFEIATHNEIVRKVAQDANWVLNNVGALPSLKRLRQIYQETLSSIGLATTRGQVRVRNLIDAFTAFYSPHALALLHCSVDSNGGWLIRLLHARQKAQHPVRHLLLIRFLGYSPGDIANFVPQDDPFGYGPWPCLNPASTHYRETVVSRCNVTYTHERVARPVGKFQCSCGFSYARTGPDKTAEDIYRLDKIVSFGAVWDARLASLWENERLGLRAIARALRVDPITVKRHLSILGLAYPRGAIFKPALTRTGQEEVLQTGSVQAPLAAQTAMYRAKWVAALANHSGMTVTEIRYFAPGVYAWLYRHDRDWLARNRPPARGARVVQRGSVDWAERDRKLSEAICIAANSLLERPERPVQITIASLARKAGHLALIQQHSNKLPLTVAAMATFVETRERFAVRRVLWAANSCKRNALVVARWQLIRLAGVGRIASEAEVSKALDVAMSYIQDAAPGEPQKE